MKYYTTLAVAALLGNVDALNVRMSQMEQDVDENMELSIDSTMQAKTSTRAQISTGCDAGIDRFTNGTSNTWQTFKSAHATSALFKDAGFPADSSSLYWPNKGGDASDIQSLIKGVSAWKRPGEMGYSGTPSLWGTKGKPVPDGIAQGSLGDCWFLAAASAVAEVPERVKRVVWNDSYDKNGAFRYFFWVKNKWHGVNIDDRLPTNKYGSPFATQRSRNGAWWMPLMEKAYAKLDQNYERIIAGMGYEGLRTLTGMPTIYINNKKGADKAGSYTLLQNLASKNFPMTSPCCNSASPYGLIGGHAYTLLNVLQLSDGTKLARIRNPWSQDTYNGPWNDKSSKWTEKFKKEAGYVDAKDGSFFMTFDIYVTEFWGASVAMYQPYKGFHQENYKQSIRSQKFTVNNPMEQEFYVQGETYSDRNYPRSCDPNNNYVLYMYGPDGKMVGTYGFIGWQGFGLVGKPGQKLPKGTYDVRVINQSAGTKVADLSIMFYFLDQKGTVKKQ